MEGNENGTCLETQRVHLQLPWRTGSSQSRRWGRYKPGFGTPESFDQAAFWAWTCGRPGRVARQLAARFNHLFLGPNPPWQAWQLWAVFQRRKLFLLSWVSNKQWCIPLKALYHLKNIFKTRVYSSPLAAHIGKGRNHSLNPVCLSWTASSCLCFFVQDKGYLLIS